jgi:DNA-binding FadR family transcriptional regulator
MYAQLLKDIELSSHETVDQIGTPTTLLEQDRRIGDAITAGDGLAAATRMREHLKTTAHLKLLAWSPLHD